VKPWYLFLIVLFVVGLVLTGLSQYYFYALGDFVFGWELAIYGGLVWGVLGAIGLLYFARWWRRRMRRFWGE
jgi:hypothetical protein